MRCSSSPVNGKYKYSKSDIASSKKRKLDEPEPKFIPKKARRVSKRDRPTIDYLRLNDGSDNEADSADEEYGPSTRKKCKNHDNVMTPTKLSEREEFVEKELPEDLMSDPVTDLPEVSDEESTGKER